jgi:hypothetical protein
MTTVLYNPQKYKERALIAEYSIPAIVLFIAGIE